MDAELKAYLQAMEQRLATKADVAELRTGLAELRAATQEDFAAVRREQAEQYDSLRTEIRGVRQAVEHAEGRLDGSIRSWKEESALALTEIEHLKRRAGHLTKRVRVLERPKP